MFQEYDKKSIYLVHFIKRQTLISEEWLILFNLRKSFANVLDSNLSWAWETPYFFFNFTKISNSLEFKKPYYVTGFLGWKYIEGDL